MERSDATMANDTWAWETENMSEAERAEARAIEHELRSYYAQENAVANNGARASFATIHQSLMNEIEADVSALDIASEGISPPQMILPPFTGGAIEHQAESAPLGGKGLGNKAMPHRRGSFWGLNFGRLTGMAGVALTAAWGGHYVGRNNAKPSIPLPSGAPSTLPVQSLENDFDATLHASTPVEFISDNGDQAASWLSQQTGRVVRLPAINPKADSQLRLLGASRRALGGLEAQAVVQAHYQLPGGARVTLYQVRAPHLGLSGLREEVVKGQTFFVKRDGRYRTVVWRSGDDLAAIVSPLGTKQSLQLAASLRAAQPSSMV